MLEQSRSMRLWRFGSGFWLECVSIQIGGGVAFRGNQKRQSNRGKGGVFIRSTWNYITGQLMKIFSGDDGRYVNITVDDFTVP